MSTARYPDFFSKQQFAESENPWRKDFFGRGTAHLGELQVSLQKYIKENGGAAPTPFTILNTGLSYLSITTNQTYAKDASNIVQVALGKIGEKYTNEKVEFIIEALKGLLDLYRKYPKGRVSSSIDNAFTQFLKVKPADMPISDKVFEKKKQEIYAAFGIVTSEDEKQKTPSAAKPQTTTTSVPESLSSSYVMISEEIPDQGTDTMTKFFTSFSLRKR